MAAVEFEPWEPEEGVGKLRHSLIDTLDAPDAFNAAAATLEETRGRIGVLFRGLGGARDVEIKAATPEISLHRLSRRRALGRSAERLVMPSFDGETLRLPERIAAFPEREANVALYLWLAASAVFARPPPIECDALRADVRLLQAAQRMTRETLAECPGLRRIYTALARETLARRPERRRLPPAEAAIEAVIRQLLGAPPPKDEPAITLAAAVNGQVTDLSHLSAPRDYRPLLPVLLWPDLRPLADRRRTLRDEETPHGEAEMPPNVEPGTFKASRKPSDQPSRKDSLILHKFETILSWTELLNINRRVDDDDEENARKAADDQDEIGLAQVPQRAKTRLRLHLELSPEEAEFERLAGEHVYPEWDYRARSYLPDYCRVLAGAATTASSPGDAGGQARSERRIRSVRRQFETLRPRRVQLTRQLDGHDIDIAAAIAARVDLVTRGEHSDRVYLATRSQERDLAVSILLDASRSTETYIAGRQVIDIAREALLALAWGLDACGDDTAIDAFSSRRRERVFVQTCKGFDEPMGAAVEARIAGLRPGHYTRLGAALRHVSGRLAERPRQRRLLLVLTDGKPNDTDHYEGRYGIEDTHMAVREARRRGQSVFGVTIDAKSQAPFSRIFGAGGYVVIPDPEKLVAALPHLYRHLVSG